MQYPCKNCDNKGCGVYHDKCEPYQKYKEEMQNAHKKEVLSNYHRPNMSETTWHYRANNIFRTHKN